MKIISKKWDNFLTSIVINIFLPLLPIFIELLARGSVSFKSFLLAMAMYIISLAICAYSKFQFVLGLSISLASAIAYGFTEEPISEEVASKYYWCSIALIFIVVIHAIERYHLHVKEGKRFFNF